VIDHGCERVSLSVCIYAHRIICFRKPLYASQHLLWQISDLAVSMSIVLTTEHAHDKDKLQP